MIIVLILFLYFAQTNCQLVDSSTSNEENVLHHKKSVHLPLRPFNFDELTSKSNNPDYAFPDSSRFIPHNFYVRFREVTIFITHISL